jgi:hypothetical protein
VAERKERKRKIRDEVGRARVMKQRIQTRVEAEEANLAKSD